MIIAYDVSDDDERAQLAALLSARSAHTTISIRYIKIPVDDTAGLEANVKGLVNEVQDRIQAFRVCENCAAASFHVGSTVEILDQRWWVP